MYLIECNTKKYAESYSVDLYIIFTTEERCFK